MEVAGNGAWHIGEQFTAAATAEAGVETVQHTVVGTDHDQWRAVLIRARTAETQVAVADGSPGAAAEQVVAEVLFVDVLGV